VAAFLITKKLLDAGADPNFCDKENGKTPLYWAAIDINLVNLLISEGAFVDAETPKDGCTSVHFSVEEDNLYLLKALVKTECKEAINTFDYIERTPLIIAAINGNVDIASVLIQCGSDVNAKSTISGKTALGEAIYEGNLDMIEFLLKNGADSSLSGWMDYENELQAKYSNRKENVEKIIDLLRN
jgi:ankyrin repeat protein